MPPPALASNIVLYIPTRSGNKRFIYMNVVEEASAWKFTAVTFFKHLTLTEDSPTGQNIGKYVVRNCDGILLSKLLKSHSGIVLKDAATNEIVPVISMAQHSTVFGSYKLKANVMLTASVAPTTTMAPSTLHTLAPSTTFAPKKKKSHSMTGELNPYVAKQLFELAVHRKEMCPITAEEFIAGNTAVMPCGHLFMQIAIEESFKKEPEKCPWCRQTGKPTYV